MRKYLRHEPPKTRGIPSPPRGYRPRGPVMVRGQAALDAARRGCDLYVFNDQEGWVPAGPGALARAERMESHALWIYGSDEDCAYGIPGGGDAGEKNLGWRLRDREGPMRRNPEDADDLVSLERLRKIFDLPEFEDAINEDYCWEQRHAVEQEILKDARQELEDDYEDPTQDEIDEVMGRAEEKAEKEGPEAEEECSNELYSKYAHAIFQTAEQYFNHVGLDLDPVHSELVGRRNIDTEWVVAPMRGSSWAKAADEIRETIGGTGIAYVPDTLDEWLEQEGWTAKGAALGHLGSLGARAEVYGLRSSERLFEQFFGD